MTRLNPTLVLPALALLISPAAPAQTTATGNLASAVFDLDKLTFREPKYGRFYPAVDLPVPTFGLFEMHYSTVKPRAVMQVYGPHHHAVEELILIKDGAFRLRLDDRDYRVGPGTLLFIAAHDRHAFANATDGQSSFYVINAYTAATVSVRDQPAIEWAPPGLLRSTVYPWDALVAKPTPTGSRRDVIDSPAITFARLEIHVTTMNPGTPPGPLRRHPWVSAIMMKEGAINATFDGATHRVGPGSLVAIAPNSWHALSNPGTVPATFFVFSLSSAQTPAEIRR